MTSSLKEKLKSERYMREKRKCIGKFTVTVFDSDGNLDPVVEFEQLGTLTEQRLEMLQPWMFRELRIARAAERLSLKQNEMKQEKLDV